MLNIEKSAKNLLNKALMRYGYEIIPSSIVFDWQRYSQDGPGCNNRAGLPEGAESYLHINHPKLMELQKRYSVFDDSVKKPLVWKSDLIRSRDILYFRGDNAYVRQLGGPNMNLNIMAYALSTYYLESIDKLDLLIKLEEDDYFGNITFNINRRTVSRDLLDSIIEIYFM